MDLDYSNEELAFRAEVSGWLANNLPADLRDKVARYEHLSRDDLLRWHRILAAKGWIAPSWPQEWGGTGWNVVQRYIFDEACGYAGAPPLVPVRVADVRAGAAQVRHASAEGALPASHLPRRGLLVPRLLRAGFRLRPGIAFDARGAPGRPLRRQRPEDVDHARAHGRLDLLPRAHRRRTPSTSRKASRFCSST